MCVNSYSDIQRIALTRLIEFDKANKSEDEFELKIIQFAESYGFKVFQDHLDCSGLIMISNDLVEKFNTNKVILIDRFDTPQRQRFTIAHEMGHYFLELQERENNGDKYIAHRDNREMPKTRKEKYADYFASVLLMPAHKIVRIMRKLPKDYDLYDLLDAVQEKFNVSQLAARVRLSQLGLVPYDF